MEKQDIRWHQRFQNYEKALNNWISFLLKMNLTNWNCKA